MQQFLQEILSLNEHHITPGERKAILDRVRDNHFDNQLIWQEIRQPHGWYDAYAVLLILLIAYKDHLLRCEEERVAHDPKPDFVAMREWIDKHWVADSYSSIIAKLRDALHDVEREKEVADFYRCAYNDQKSQIQDFKETNKHLADEVAYWKSQAKAATVNPAERNAQTYGEQELTALRALWARAIKEEALREEVIYRLSQCRSVPEAMKEVMAPLFKNKKADFKQITNVDIASWLLQTLRLKKLPTEGHLKRELGNIRPAKKK